MENLNINYDKTVSNATVSMISAGYRDDHDIQGCH